MFVCSARPLLALDPQRELRNYGHQVWLADNGLPQNTVHAIVQTRDGFLWLGTEAGLARFDGLDFVVFDKQNTAQLKSNDVRSLFEDRSGALWISTAEGLTRLSGSKFTIFTSSEGLPSSNVWSVYEDHSGVLWVTTAEGLARYENNHFTPYTARSGLSSDNIGPVLETRDGSISVGTAGGLDRFNNKDGRFTNALPGVNVHALQEDKDGHLWIGTQEGLKSLGDSQRATLTVRDGLPSNDVQILHTDAAGRLWIGTPNGLAVLEKSKITAYTTRNGLPGNRIENVYEDREGTIWISTDRGLARFQTARFQNGGLAVFTPKEGLSSNTIESIYEDREGNLWLGTESSGLHVLRDQKFITYTSKEGLSDDLVRSVFEDRAGNLWVATNGGGLNLFKQAKFTAFTTTNGLPSNIILALADDREGNLWIGTPDGLSKFRNGTFTTFTAADGLADPFVRSIYEDRDGVLWIGTRRGLSRFDKNKFITYTTTDGLASDFVGTLLQDHDGSLWVGTLGGLSHFSRTEARFINYSTKDGLSSNIITALYQDGDGILWIGTNGGGLNRLRYGKVTPYLHTQGMPEVIYRILEDGHGRLWMSSPQGVFQIKKKVLNQIAETGVGYAAPIPYGTAEGMKISECSGGGHPSAWKSRDGKLWFSTVKGVALIDPEDIGLNELPPPVVIEQVSVDDEALKLGEKIEIAPNHSRFAFHYAGLNFVAPQKVRYKYKLEGFDKDWIDAGTRRVAYYTNISPGNYKFRVLAANNDGDWNENGAALSFRFQPHLYQTYWFYALCVLSLGLLGRLAYRMRVRRMQSEFAAVLAERNRIARDIHDTLAQGFVGISLQLELVSKMLSTSVEGAKEQLDQTRILVRNSLAEARRSIWELRSQSNNPHKSNWESGDLPGVLSNAAKRIAANNPVQVHFQVTGAYRELPHELETNLMRIGQEAIANAIQHAQAAHINIDLQYEPKRLRLSIRDDGRGFSVNGCVTTASFDGRGHFGIVGMRERAEQIGGKFKLESTPGEGTEVSVEAEIK